MRRATVELMISADASVLQSKFFKSQGYIKGTRDRGDLSYAAAAAVGHDRPRTLVKPTRRSNAGDDT